MDTTTTLEEAACRKMLHNTQVLHDCAPRTLAGLSRYQAKWKGAVLAEEFPEPLSQAELVSAVLSIPLRPRPEFEEFRDQFFGREGAYFVR